MSEWVCIVRHANSKSRINLSSKVDKEKRRKDDSKHPISSRRLVAVVYGWSHFKVQRRRRQWKDYFTFYSKGFRLFFCLVSNWVFQRSGDEGALRHDHHHRGGGRWHWERRRHLPLHRLGNPWVQCHVSLSLSLRVSVSVKDAGRRRRNTQGNGVKGDWV